MNGDDPSLKLDGNYVWADELPKIIRNAKLEIVNDEADIVLYLPHKGKICIGYTDGEYAHIPCISTSQIMSLIMANITSNVLGF